MKKFLALGCASMFLFASCNSDDTPTCRTCNSQFTISFQLCKQNNGNASVNGEDTGVGYAVYLDGLVNEGVECN